VNGWLSVHTGVVDELGSYYAFWSGFGSDFAEFGIIGAVANGVYQLVRKYNLQGVHRQEGVAVRRRSPICA
jgi:hypothetical protein